MSAIRFPLLVWVMLIFMGCNKPQTPPVDTRAEIEAIHRIDSLWFAAEQRKDVEVPVSYVTEDVVFQPTNAPPIVGIAAVRKFYEDLYKLPIESIGGGSTKTVVAASGELAYDIGTNYAVLNIQGKRVRDDGKYLAVFQKVAGQWKCSAISWSSNNPPPK